MNRRERGLRSILLAGVTLWTASGGLAAAATDSAQQKIDALQQQIQDLSAQIDDLKRSTAAQYADSQRREAEKAAATKSANDAVKVSIDNGRPTIASSDGQFSASLRALVQFDSAYYMQGHAARTLPAASGPDLSSGANFRRVYLGLQGKVFGDWAYNVNFDFGGSNGTEQGGRIQSAYLEYDGLAPWAFRMGAYPVPAGLEDSTSPQDTIFLERTAPSDVVRNTAAGDGRDAATLIYAGDRVFGALSWTGGKVGDGAAFDEQSALVGKLAGLVVSESDAKLVVSTEGTWLFKAADTTALNNSTTSLTLSAAPELTVDSTGTKLVTTGALSADSAREWGLETGGYWHNLFAQGGYFGYEVKQRVTAPALPKPDLNFYGWYAEATWIITGESRGWNPATGAFTPPRPKHDFVMDRDGWGAWELAERFSELDLNDLSGASGLVTPYGGARGGKQQIYTGAINWYPNPAIKFSLDYQYFNIGRLNAAAPYTSVGQKAQAVSLRAQLSL
jgi:phosphate-selective porin OprO/OprP